MTQPRCRLDADIRKQQIIDAAMLEALERGFARLTCAGIARRAGVSPGLVAHYLGRETDIRRVVMRTAIKRDELKILAQGLAVGDPTARRAPPEKKAQAAQFISGC